VAPRTDAKPHDGPKSLHEVGTELWELARDYAKQETIDPLKGLGRFLGLGIGGAIALGIGISMLLLGTLRLLQTETGSTFTGNLSWAPYLLTTVVGLVAIGLALLRISKRKGPGA
jgi:hypothetical protein